MEDKQTDIYGANGIKFIPYNTGMPQMKMSAYGRNIQNMVDYCVEIPDREERTVCAYGIVGVMKTLFPNLVGEKGDLQVFWNHLNVLSGFKLDIDFPVEVMTEEKLNPQPAKIPYSNSKMKYRHYGRSLEGMLNIVADMEPGDEREELISLCAHQMKKMLLMYNPEGVDNARVLNDLREYTHGKIDLDPATYELHDFQDITPVKEKKSKKKKKSGLF